MPSTTSFRCAEGVAAADGSSWATQCLPELFEAQVTRAPDAVAVTYGGDEVTYGDLNARANRLARHLRRFGVGPEVRVGLYTERSLEAVVGLLGILKAGGAYVPLDPDSPPERLGFIVRDAQAPVVLTEDRLVRTLSHIDAEVVCLDTSEEWTAGKNAQDFASGIKPDNLAYTIYTSGSTGWPKGVLVSHYNVVRLFGATRPWFDFNERDVWTLFHSLAFDFSVWELWGALLHGGRLVVVPYRVSRSPDAFYDLLSRERVTVLNQTPSAFRQLVQLKHTVGASEELPLRTVIFGGETLDLASLRPWLERHGGQRPQLVNMYGLTETTVHTTCCPLRAVDEEPATGSPIGKPIVDLQVYVLDGHLDRVPVGVPGELHVGGAGLARGYLNHADLTAERFIPDPFGTESGARLYRTGDRARYRPDGTLEFLGRNDDQVKIRGFRVELGEVQAALARHPAVAAAVVVVRDVGPGERQLVAYVVWNQQPAPSSRELRDFLGAFLPDYMVPQAFVALPTLPLTLNGKIDRKALPLPTRTRQTAVDPNATPRTPLEAALATLWADALGLEGVGVHDDFFALGGDSLLAAQLAARVGQAVQIELPLWSIFEAPTVAGLAAAIHELDTRTAPASGTEVRTRHGER